MGTLLLDFDDPPQASLASCKTSRSTRVSVSEGEESTIDQRTKSPRRLLWRIVGLSLLAVGALVFVFLSTALATAWKPIGKMASGERLVRMQKSPQWKGDKFVDAMPRVEPDLLKVLRKWVEEPHPFRRPKTPPTHVTRRKADFNTPPQSGLRITWLGHSTLIIEIGGKRLLVDPVWGKFVAPLELENAERFMPPPLPFKELPDIDAVLISHDHYDHLDYPTIVRLKERNVPFFVPLGVGAHLEYWGVPPELILEKEWWQEHVLGDLVIACTPARHFSGRSLVDKDKTLWSGWAVISAAHRVYYSGDTALFPGFKEIGRKYGPFDATMMESGAYNQMWADVHLGPEQAVVAHQMLRGGVLIPVHWGMFDLGLHGWTEPMERILVAAEKANVQVVTMLLGSSVEPAFTHPVDRWWPDHPWETAEEAPVTSSGLEGLKLF
jgi:L-ascorbate metabolism protein UlaG (beta-lactamase superfamily)